MRFSELFGKTRREAPAGIADPARRLAFRAGLLRELGGGETVYLPLAARVMAHISTEIRSGLFELGAQELRVGASPDLSSLFEREIQSYKQLPVRLFWFEKGGTLIQLASLSADKGSGEEEAGEFEGLAVRLFGWAQVPWAVAQAGQDTRIWYSPSDAGDLELLSCSKADYAATRAAARVYKPPAAAEEPLPVEHVATPHCDTIDSLAQFLGVPTLRTAKAVFYHADGQLVFAIVRGDLLIDEGKLKETLGLTKLRFATDDEISQVGASPGYASPIGVRGAKIVVDDSIVSSPNLVAGANREGFHLLNTNVPRDYRPDIVADIALARPGSLCPNGDGTLQVSHGIEMGGTREHKQIQGSYLDATGKPQMPFGGGVEINLASVVLAYVGSHNDSGGIMWSPALAPFVAHIVVLNADKPEVAAAAARVTQELELAGIDYLLDDRAESAGVKFADADLIGLPVRLTIGPRTVAQNAVEVKPRDKTEARIISIDQVVSNV